MCRSDFLLRSVVEKCIGKDKKRYAAFLNLVKAYGRVDMKPLIDVLIYGMSGRQLERIEALLRRAEANVRVEGGLSEEIH